MTQTQASRKTEYVWATLTGFIALVVYWATLAPTVLFADGGEFQFVPWMPAIAHPTGYPLYTLLGWLFSHTLPFGEVAFRLNLFSAVTGAVAVGIVFLLAQEMSARILSDATSTARRLAATIAALSFAFGQAFWSQAIIAEVYSLHALFVALILWQSLRVLAKTPSKSTLTFSDLWLLAFIFGLSLTHHRTGVLLFPALVWAFWTAGARRISPADAFKLLLVGASPALFYLYFPIIAPTVPYVQLHLSDTQTLTLYQNTAAGFIAHIMGSVFGADVEIGAVNFARLTMVVQFLRQQVGWAGGLLGAIGLFQLRKNRPILALTLGSFIAIFAFNLVYFIGDIFVLFIPCWLILSLWIGLGALFLAQKIGDSFMRQKRARAADGVVFSAAMTRYEKRMSVVLQSILVGAGLILPMVLLSTRWNDVSQAQNTIARDAWQEILAADLPQNAVLLSNDRNELMPMWYFQYVENRRPDLLGIFPLITADPQFATVGGTLDAAFNSGRPVFFIKPMDGLSLKADMTPLPPSPHAQLMRATKANLTPAHPLSVSIGDGLRVVGYTSKRVTSTLTVDIFWQRDGASATKENYTGFVHLVGADGAGITQSDHRLGGDYYPTKLWQAGEILRDQHTLTLPDDLPAGEYSLVVGLYFQPSTGEIQSVGQTLIRFVIRDS